MDSMNTESNRPARRWVCGALITLSLTLGAAACGGGDASGPELSAAGERGKSLSSSSGCAGCHGTNGQGGVGPTWQGLAGAEVELADGTMVVADEESMSFSFINVSGKEIDKYTITKNVVGNNRKE